MRRTTQQDAADAVLRRAIDQVERSFPHATASVWLAAGREPTPALGALVPDDHAATMVTRCVERVRIVQDRNRGRIAVPLTGSRRVLGAFLFTAPAWNNIELIFLEHLATETGVALEHGLLRSGS